MKTARIVRASLAVFGVFAAACDLPGEEAPEIEEGTAELSAKVTVCKRESDWVRLKLEMQCKSNETACRNHLLAIEQRTLAAGDLQRVVQVVTRRGQPLIETQVSADTVFTDESRRYHAPITGIQTGEASDDGELVWVTVDGRGMHPAPSGTRFEQMSFLDGRPRPNFVIPADLRPLLRSLFDLAKKESETCIKKLNGTLGGSSTALIAGGNLGHNSITVDNKSCRGLQGACEIGYSSCFWGAASASVGCGPFALLCAGGGILACAGAKLLCLQGAHKAGGPCCPVACGGEGKAHNFTAVLFTRETIGCCLATEKCVVPNSGACCSANEPPCGGRCCGSPNVCLHRGTNSEYCCEPQRVCNGQCCGADSECRTINGFRGCFRRCQVRSDCDIDDACVGGFCQPG